MNTERKLRKLYLKGKIPFFLLRPVLQGVQVPEVSHVPWDLHRVQDFENRILGYGVGKYVCLLLFAVQAGILYAYRSPTASMWFGILLAITTTASLYGVCALWELIKEAKPPEFPKWWSEYTAWFEDLIIRSGYDVREWLKSLTKEDRRLYEKERFESKLRYELEHLAKQIMKAENQGRKGDAEILRREFSQLLAAGHRFRIIEGGASEFFAPAIWSYEI